MYSLHASHFGVEGVGLSMGAVKSATQLNCSDRPTLSRTFNRASVGLADDAVEVTIAPAVLQPSGGLKDHRHRAKHNDLFLLALSDRSWVIFHRLCRSGARWVSPGRALLETAATLAQLTSQRLLSRPHDGERGSILQGSALQHFDQHNA
jgi:hypothetical protein